MEENISAYPQAVTRQMLQNFMTGGACISVIAKEYNAKLGSLIIILGLNVTVLRQELLTLPHKLP